MILKHLLTCARKSSNLLHIHSSGAHIMPKFLTQREAIDIDQQLFNDYQFEVVQLMELAGLSCAQAIAKCFPPQQQQSPLSSSRVLVLCGPGNNGGDGLVCARHLALMGYQPAVICSRPPDSPLFKRLLHQASSMSIPVDFELPAAAADCSAIDSSYDLIVDALFGFSFRPPVRPQFAGAMNLLCTTKLPVASIDIPSGWDVESGPGAGAPGFQPQLLISLTAPKLCAKFFTGPHHYLGGRFVPPALAAKYELGLPEYPGIDACVRLAGN